MQDCLNCGDPAHTTPSCHRPRHVYIDQLRPSHPDQLHKTLVSSLDGARRGRAVGWRVAQSRAAAVVLKACRDLDEGLRVSKMIMELEDR